MDVAADRETESVGAGQVEQTVIQTPIDTDAVGNGRRGDAERPTNIGHEGTILVAAQREAASQGDGADLETRDSERDRPNVDGGDAAVGDLDREIERAGRTVDRLAADLDDRRERQVEHAGVEVAGHRQVEVGKAVPTVGLGEEFDGNTGEIQGQEATQIERLGEPGGVEAEAGDVNRSGVRDRQAGDSPPQLQRGDRGRKRAHRHDRRSVGRELELRGRETERLADMEIERAQGQRQIAHAGTAETETTGDAGRRG